MYKKDQKGFTIIEVLIVLAIAALILLIVFLAVPALQRNNRNTQRKNDVSNVLGAISEFNANKNGKMPQNFTEGEFRLRDGVEGSGVTPKIGFYTTDEIVFENNNNPMRFRNPIPSEDASRMYVKTGAKCDNTGSDFGGAGASSRTVAVVYVIETSGGSTSVCQES